MLFVHVDHVERDRFRQRLEETRLFDLDGRCREGQLRYASLARRMALLLLGAEEAFRREHDLASEHSLRRARELFYRALRAVLEAGSSVAEASSDDESQLALDGTTKQLVAIALPVRDVNDRAVLQPFLCQDEAAQPAQRFALRILGRGRSSISSCGPSPTGAKEVASETALRRGRRQTDGAIRRLQRRANSEP